MHLFTGFFGLLASCVLTAQMAYADSTVPLAPQTGKPAPILQYKDEKGVLHTVGEAHARLTAVHFWATWCVPCVIELPLLDAAAAAYKDKGLSVVAISLDGSDIGRVQKFFADHNIKTLTPATDETMVAFQSTHAPGLPTTIFVDAKGNEIARAEGPLDWTNKTTTDFIDAQLK